MFKFLKEKLKSAISRISERIEKEGRIEEKVIEEKIIEKSEEKLEKPAEEIKKDKKEEEKGFFAKFKEKLIGKEDEKIIEEKKEDIKKEIEKAEEKTGDETPKIAEAKVAEPKVKKKDFFTAIKEKIVTTRINEQQFGKLFLELELALMENNTAIEVIEKIKNDLKGQLVEKPITRTKVEDTIFSALKNSIEGLFQGNKIDLLGEIKSKKEKPYVIAFFGINGSGKTTSIAKLANMMKENKISCVLAASDTFRAASIEQLQHHSDKLGVKLIKHDYGADPAAVAFDAVKHAKAKAIDAVLIDTAGRMHSNQNLIDELKKITRVAKPDLKIFVGESITGNDCIEQAKTFNEAVGIDGIILAKADVDEKGGAAISVIYVTKKPILFLGTGQKYSDLEPFSKERVMRGIGMA